MRFYRFGQNNSGGMFTYNDNLTEDVFVQANDYTQANSIAENLGIYFDGCNRELDCNCCGDRWCAVDESDKAIESQEEFDFYLNPSYVFNSQKPFAIFHLLNGMRCRVYKNGSVELHVDGQILPFDDDSVNASNLYTFLNS